MIISGGGLADINNEAFARGSVFTLAFLLGTANGKTGATQVKALWCHNWEDIYKADWQNGDLQEFCTAYELGIVGSCVVKPEEEKPTPSLEDMIQETAPKIQYWYVSIKVLKQIQGPNHFEVLGRGVQIFICISHIIYRLRNGQPSAVSR